MSLFICLAPRPHYYARPMRIGSRGPSELIRHRNALTEKAWEDAVQGLGELLYLILSRGFYSQSKDCSLNSCTRGHQREDWGNKIFICMKFSM